MIGSVSKIKSRLTSEVLVMGLIFVEFFHIEAIEPPIKNI